MNSLNQNLTTSYLTGYTGYNAGTQTSSAKCITKCKAGISYFKKHKYAVLEKGGSCYCGSAEPMQQLGLAECPMTCSGDHTDYCGGSDNHATFYSTNVTGNIFRHFNFFFNIFGQNRPLPLIKVKYMNVGLEWA